jgi:hypothetical protein
LGPQQFAQSKAIDARHLEIESHEVATNALQHAQRCRGFGNSHNTILGRLEDFTEPVTGYRVVVNY